MMPRLIFVQEKKFPRSNEIINDKVMDFVRANSFRRSPQILLLRLSQKHSSMILPAGPFLSNRQATRILPFGHGI